MEDQLSQRGVQVVGLSEAVACGRLVDHTVLDVSFRTTWEKAGRNHSIPYNKLVGNNIEGKNNMLLLLSYPQRDNPHI